MRSFRGLMLFLVLLLGLLRVAPVPAYAAALTSRSLIMTRQQTSTATNFDVRFTTPTGVESSSDTVTLTLPSDFSYGSVAFGDIDFFHGATTGFETEETLAATAAAGVWGASVSGQVLTLTAPTNAAAGEITAGDKVVLRIGTNASGGTNQITNPSVSGTYILSVAGTFGDSGSYDVFIGSADSISVTATVSATSTTTTSSGGGPSGGTDGTPPVISALQVINITTSTAQVIWVTDEPADSIVEFGLTASYGLGPVSDTALVLSHSIYLTGLTPETLYHLRVTSRDVIANSATSPDTTFQTLAPPHAPVLSNIHVNSITGSSAVVLWDTDIPANSIVEYGPTAAYGNVLTGLAFITNHALQLVGLSQNTLYHYRVISAGPTGLTTQSTDHLFTTLGDTLPPSNVFAFHATPGDQQVALTWTNPGDADFAYVRILAKTNGFPMNPDDGRLVYQGSLDAMTDAGLTNGTHYYYANFAYDASGNHASGAFADAIPFGPGEPEPEPEVPIPPTGTPTTTLPQPPTTTEPVPPLPPVEVTPIVGLRSQYFGADGTVLLEQDLRGSFGAFVGQPVQVRIPIIGLEASPVSAVINVGGLEYLLVPLLSGDAWGATFIPSDRIQTLPISITIRFADGREQTLRNDVIVQGYGRVTFVNERNEKVPASGERVTLYRESGGVYGTWNGAAFAQRNPALTDVQGLYGFLVPNGRYRVRVEKEGFVTIEKEVNVRLNVVNLDTQLQPIPVTPVAVALSLLQTEEAQQTASVAAPVVAVIALGNLVAAANLLSLLQYFWFLLTQPILLLGRKKRKEWGTVYNALSKRPVDLAIVRLFHAEKNVLIQTRISDKEGRYFFTVKPGVYRIEVARNGFTFPSTYLKKEREDGDYLDVYHGERITVREETTIGVNIPLDPAVSEATPKQIQLKNLLRKFQHGFSLMSVVLSAIILAISPTLLLFGLFVFQVVVYLLFRRLAMAKKPKEWGIVYDKETKKPIRQAIVRVFDAKFGKVLETQVTDEKGRYGFVVGKNEYFLTVDGRGYETLRTNVIDMKQSKDTVIHEKLGVTHVKS